MCVAHGLENVSKAQWTRVLEEIKKSLSSNLSGNTLLFISLVYYCKNKMKIEYFSWQRIAD